MIRSTYTYPKKEDVEIVVGDEKQDRFYPRMKIKRWDNEVNFSVGIISDHVGVDSKISDRIEWNDDHGVKARFYEKEGEEFEFEIELASKPSSNVIELSIQSKGLRFLYQPELTQAEIDKGNIRPDNVIGSYAVYHQFMKGNYIDGKNYRSGKIFHIYRPFVTDTEGKCKWCGMNITESVMRITVPDGLVYPVVIDPTFGTDSASPGASWVESEDDVMIGTLFTSPANIDTAQSVSVYVKKVGTFSMYNFNIKNVIVLHSNLNIITNGIGGESAEVASTTGIWVLSDFATDPSPTTSTEYVLMTVQGGSAARFYLAYDSGSANQGHVDTSNSYSPSPTDPTDATHNSNEYSIYCTYTATVGNSLWYFNMLKRRNE